MLEALIVWENVILYSIDPIRRSASQPLVVLLHPGDKILEFFGLPGLHVCVGGLGDGVWARLEVESCGGGGD